MKYKELNIGDWFMRTDITDKECIFIRTADIQSLKPSTCDFILYPQIKAGDCYLSPDPETQIIFITQLPIAKRYYRHYMISVDGEYQRLDKNMLFFCNLSNNEVSLIFIHDFNDIGIVCTGKNAGIQIDFANVKLRLNSFVNPTTSTLSCYEDNIKN